jgi:hypothetical protein
VAFETPEVRRIVSRVEDGMGCAPNLTVSRDCVRFVGVSEPLPGWAELGPKVKSLRPPPLVPPPFCVGALGVLVTVISVPTP